MSSMAVDGLISGLNTTELIKSLMQLEAAPQTLLKSKSSAASSLASALQSLNTKVASLATSAGKAADAASWDAHKVASSSGTVTATATAGASPSAMTFTVDRIAAGQVSLLSSTVSASLAVEPPPAITVVRDGTTVTIQPAHGTMADVAEAINKAKDAGLSAVAVAVGTDGTYRLQLSGISGASNAFEVYLGGAEAVGDPTKLIVNRSDAVGGDIAGNTTIATAVDATITLWAGTAAATEITSSTNTFADTIPGVSFTVKEPSADPVTLTVAQDQAAQSALAADLVNNVTTVLAEISSRTATSTTTGADGREIVAGGLFSGNGGIRMLGEQVRSAVSMPVDGRSPSAVGITLDRSGTVSFDQVRFTAAMAADPVGTQEMVTALAERLAGVATSASDAATGTLTLQITSQEGVVKDLNQRITDWDTRLATRRAGLERTYAALEVALSGLQSQSNWLAGQLSGLPSWNTSS
ncbi:MAG: flagellar filament capping protein FliD [Georgenia sp.]